MPRGLSWRIGLSFAVLAVAVWIAIGAALLVVLRGLHADATRSNLADVATPLVVQARQRLPAAGDIRTVLSDLHDQVTEQGYSVFLMTADGRLVTLDGSTPPADAIRVPTNAGRDATFDGSYRIGTQTYAWLAIVLRQPQGLGPRALVLATPDRSGADALRDLFAALPAVVVVSVLVGAPIAWLIARSVGRPLRRLAAATASLPLTAGPAPPLPLDGPTEVREVTSRFNAMAAELQRTRQEEADLLANLRHDLRTPVTVISGFATALADGTAAGDDVSRAAKAIEEEASRLEDLVSQLGASQRLSTGEASLRPEPIPVAELLVATAERFRTAGEAQSITVVVMDPPAGLVVNADRSAVDRILGNLVGNAIAALGAAPTAANAAAPATEPSPATAPAATAPAATAAPSEPVGHIWLSAARVAGPRGGDAVALTVTDDGPGFPPGTLSRVFERFYRADPSRARPSAGGGSGLGLSIVRDLARAHGGEAFAENIAPHGARVSAVFPLIPGGRPVARQQGS